MPRCKDCPFKDHPIVEGFGPDETDLVILGESPGRDEHVQGRPFTGPSGQVLDECLHQAELPTPYLTNSSLCTPPPDEFSKLAAVNACRKERHAEIVSRKPKVVMSLGGFAAQSLINDSKGITRRVGEKHWWNNSWVILNEHPAYLLRGGYEDFPRFVECLRLGKKIIDGSAPVSMDVPYIESFTRQEALGLLEELQPIVSAGHPLSLDLETSGFNPYAARIVRGEDGTPRYEKDRIILVIIGTREKSYLFHEQAFLETYEEIKEFLEQPRLTLLMHVAVFDAGFLRASGIKVGSFHDTALEHYTLNEIKYTHGLKELARVLLGADDWESDIKRYLPSPKKSSYTMIPKPALAKYGSYDGVFTYGIHDEIHERLGEDESNLLQTIIMPAQRMFFDTRDRGTKIDVKRLLEVDEQIQIRSEQLAERMRDIADDPGFNPASPIQCAKIVYDKLQLKPVLSAATTSRLKTGASAKGLSERSTAEDALLDLPKVPFTESLIEYRELQHDRSHYTLGMLPFLDENDRIHPQVDLSAAVNGRIASTMPSVLNVKRPPKPEDITDYNDIRSLYVADDGYLLFEADQAQFELRNYAVFAQIKRMLEAFADNVDIHEYTDKLMGLNDRVQAKAVNFGIIYGLMLMSLANRLGVDPNDRERMKWVKECYDLINSYFPGIKEFEELEVGTVQRTGELINPFGRKRRFPLITENNVHSVRNEALNFRTSSVSSDLNLLSAIRLHKREEELEINIFWTIHDSILGQVKKECVDSLYEVARVMENTPREALGGSFSECKYEVDLKIGKNWGHMEKLKKETIAA
ncbi:hypothetical protein LCGC14_0918820 [marine sediment metagenome]|uniref:DNA-directed DNA polymerase n=1 Tax=marine sediment metagenome TaxID=412755 RepID=A0A0F9RA31_9ZZZZ